MCRCRQPVPPAMAICIVPVSGWLSIEATDLVSMVPARRLAIAI